MKRFLVCLFTLISVVPYCSNAQDPVVLIEADDPNIVYTGRVDFTNPKAPRFWASGVYISFRFTGGTCEVVLNDQLLNGDYHNYIEVIVDGGPPRRQQLRAKSNRLQVARDLEGEVHTVVICKNTDPGVGWLEFVGIRAKGLAPPANMPARKIEFVGNSITTGAGIDTSEYACDSAKWYDQDNAYLSYGPVTARNLNAQWQLTATAGIGLLHSPGLNITMPQVYDKISMRTNTVPWDFKKFQPDVVIINLGENDGIQDSVRFCDKYREFLRIVRFYSPAAKIVCLNSPMAEPRLNGKLKNYITSVVAAVNGNGDKNVSRFFFSKSFTAGCGGHPALDEHQQIAAELTEYLKKLMKW
jgi:lysophospholipase L1-like esterase